MVGGGGGHFTYVHHGGEFWKDIDASGTVFRLQDDDSGG